LLTLWRFKEEERMKGTTVVLVTGVASYWGSRVAARLAAKPGYAVMGLDLERPERQIPGLDVIQADVRNPLLADLLRTEGVEMVCHLAFEESRWPNRVTFDKNVVGATKVLGASAEAGVRKVVLKSSTAAYGARPGNPAFLTETHSLRGSKRWGVTRDLLEIEAFCKGFRRTVPSLELTILRFPSIVGPAVRTPMTRFLREPWAPSLLGFDPMMQLIHEEDVVGALAHAVTNGTPGVFNVAAEDALPLNKIRGLAGKSPFSIYHPFAYRSAKLLGRIGRRSGRFTPIDLDYLRYPWVADLTRMRDELGFVPRYTAEETLREFAEHFRGGSYMPDSTTALRDHERLRDVMDQRRQARERQAQNPATGEGVEENE
jgi:UDP-glucose 4-epimerase